MKEVKMPKQTAVEWLIQELKLNESMYKSTKDILDHTLAMEKEQLIDAWKDAEGYNDENAVILAKQYYNETYQGGQDA